MFYIRNNLFIKKKSPRPTIKYIKQFEIFFYRNITFDDKLQMKKLYI